MNALVDEDVIEALYRASIAGVQITLLIRGICCLRPGVMGISENIEVRAIVDRYLEHGRVFHFANGGKDEVYLSSADWMPRNFHRRVELMVPIEDVTLRGRLVEALALQFADTAKAWRLLPTGKYERVTPGDDTSVVRSQQRFIELTRDKLKSARVEASPQARFLMTPTAQRSALEGKVPKASKRRRRPVEEP